jgi:DNA-binding MarR family transcriptional regulator
LDGRKKLVHLTAKADRHYQKLSGYLNKALQEIINPISPKANI